jgi:AcrR family transcriptional regulator
LVSKGVIVTTSQIRPRRQTVRAGIVAAAEAEFLQHGYDRATVTEIAGSAGFTKGAVYSNFGGKPELLSAVCAAHIDAIADAVTAAFVLDTTAQARPSDPARLIGRALAAEITRTSSWPALWTEFRTLAAHDPAIRSAYAGLRIQLCDGVEQRLRTHADDLALPVGIDFAVAATLLLTLAHGLALEHTAAPEAVSTALVEECLTQLIRGLQ